MLCSCYVRHHFRGAVRATSCNLLARLDCTHHVHHANTYTSLMTLVQEYTQATQFQACVRQDLEMLLRIFTLQALPGLCLHPAHRLLLTSAFHEIEMILLQSDSSLAMDSLVMYTPTNSFAFQHSNC